MLRSSVPSNSRTREKMPSGNGGIKAEGTRVLRTLYLFNDYFTYKGEKCRYEDVYGIYQYASQFSINLIPIAWSSDLTVYLLRRNPIQLSTALYSLCELFTSSWFGIRSPLQKAYTLLSGRTFKYRAMHYWRELESTGQVDLAVSPKTLLCGDGTLVQADKSISLREVQFAKSVRFGSRKLLSTDPYEVTVWGKEYGAIKFHSHHDQDVIAALLKSACAG